MTVYEKVVTDRVQFWWQRVNRFPDIGHQSQGQLFKPGPGLLHRPGEPRVAILLNAFQSRSGVADIVNALGHQHPGVCAGYHHRELDLPHAQLTCEPLPGFQQRAAIPTRAASSSCSAWLSLLLTAPMNGLERINPAVRFNARSRLDLTHWKA